MLGSLAGSYSGSRFSLRRSSIENGSALVEPVVTARPPRPDTAAAHPPRDALRAPGAFADRGMGQPQNRRASSPARTHPPRRRAVGIGMPSLPPQHPPPPVHPPGRAVQSAHRPGGGRARTPTLARPGGGPAGSVKIGGPPVSRSTARTCACRSSSTTPAVVTLVVLTASAESREAASSRACSQAQSGKRSRGLGEEARQRATPSPAGP